MNAAQSSDHPKRQLYDNAYDPIVACWFDILFNKYSVDLGKLSSNSNRSTLETSLICFEELLLRVTDEAVTAASSQSILLETVKITHRDSIIWGSSGSPEEGASDQRFLELFCLKIRRNVGQALIEALVTLHSALTFARRCSGVEKAKIYPMLLASTNLISHLAALHDKEQVARIKSLLHVEGFDYPQVTIKEILCEKYTIAPDNFALHARNDTRHIVFKRGSKTGLELDSPTLTCPAHRLKSNGKRLNDKFWELLVQIYATAEPFGA